MKDHTPKRSLSSLHLWIDNLLYVELGLVPLFGIDVWEHAYYLQYKNARKDYVTAIYEVANWNDVAARLEAAMKWRNLDGNITFDQYD